ncbi:hypothetical protein [Streptomyces sp. NPDC050287]|uniref:hypothetical protein n=1 Tax=Streptomyces sp. NPDC050287 TaxID=3365608 RepID=UPI0037875679
MSALSVVTSGIAGLPWTSVGSPFVAVPKEENGQVQSESPAACADSEAGLLTHRFCSPASAASLPAISR